MLSAIHNRELSYPAAGEAFSPSERYPEYRFEQVASRPNVVYAAVREVLAQAGLDAEHFGTPAWNPFGRWIRPGQRVFVLCNFVYHRRPAESEADFLGKCTHASVIRAVVDYLLLAVGESGSVRFGNAPLQGCRWEQVLAETGAAEVSDFYRRVGAPVEATDLRLHVAERNALGWFTRVEDRSDANGVAVDLGQESLLAPLDRPGVRYRVLDYDPARTERCHADGRHVYILNKAILDSDVIVSVPKLKTHEKVGITCVLKGCVGAIGHKDCLAHHRQGPPSVGDEYPGDPVGVLRTLSRVHDCIQGTGQATRSGRLLRVADRVVRKIAAKAVTGTGGAWWGNDTAWRMSVDIARIIAHADAGGRLHEEIVRPHLGLVDGVIGGEGAGPLAPVAAPTGLLLFGDDPVSVDRGCAVAMGYDPDRIAMIREAARLSSFALADVAPDEQVVLNGSPAELGRLGERVGHKYLPAPGWAGYL